MSREKGILIVTKKGGATVKRADGKETNILTKYDYSAFIPASGKARTECEYESNEKRQAVKVFVNGQELPKDTEAEKKKQERIARQQAEEEQKRLEAEEKKRNEALIAQSQNDSFEIEKAFCPKDTMDIGIQAYQVDNFALKLNKFARFEENEKDFSKSNFEFFKTGRRGTLYQIKPNYGDLDFKQLTKRNEENAVKLLGGSDYCKTFLMSTNGRLITGLGGASVYETDITLHHIYGFPYLPASGIKGVVRSWIIQRSFASENAVPNNEKEHPLVNAEFRAYQNAAFCRIFGCPAKVNKVLFDEKGNILKDDKGKYRTIPYDVAFKDNKDKGQENKGSVLFFDAFPTATPNVVPDVMNPHYGPYYSGEKPPADYHNPVPIFFLTVDKETQFQFILGSKNKNWLDGTPWKIGEMNIVEWLKDALQNFGIGAKTAVGYGYLS